MTEGYLPNERTIVALDPGNAYVDWVGYDPYNFFTCHNTAWPSFSQTVDPFYRRLIASHFRKPIVLAEYGSAADQGFNARLPGCKGMGEIGDAETYRIGLTRSSQISR